MSENNKYDIVHVKGYGLTERWRIEKELTTGSQTSDYIIDTNSEEYKSALRSALNGPAFLDEKKHE